MTYMECLSYFKIGPGPITSPDAGFEEAARHLCRMGILRPVFVQSSGTFWYFRKKDATASTGKEG